MNSNNSPETVQQNAVKDIDAGGNVTVGDINQIGYQTNNYGMIDFVELSLDQYKIPSFPSPRITEGLVEDLRQQGLLVLGGSSDVDKDSLARHIAACLIEKFSSENQKIIAEEWSRSSSLQGVDVKLQNTKVSTILVLTRVSPQDVGYDLARIQRSATSANHYVILTTADPLTAWKLPDRVKALWHELTIEDVADSERLINNLSNEESLQWYHEKRDRPREQLLALGLSFFSGLFDDQFFAALEKVVDQTWKRREESLRSLDYCDLDNLGNFFNFTKTKTQGTEIIEIRFPKQRQILFKAAWESHRRQILSALPILVTIVKESASEKTLNQELYGTEAKRRQIRQVISETISAIGAISGNAIQSTLLRLAADENILIKSTAASAMARWREPDYGLDKQLFDTLHNWFDAFQSQNLIDQVEAFLKGKQTSNETLKAQDYIKATVALTVGDASLYDPPIEFPGSSGLPEELFDLIKRLEKDASLLVKQTFFDATLPKVLYLHLVQLSDWLLNIVKQQASSSNPNPETVKFSNIGVGKSLAIAYVRSPDRTVKLLDAWTEEAHRMASLSGIDISEVTPRESLLATVAWTYGAIEFRSGESFLAPTDIFERLYSLLKIEKHPFVREAILEAIIYQASRNLRDVEAQLQSLITYVKDEERKQLITALGLIYLQQRINLKGGEYWSPIRTFGDYSYRYQIWVNSDRPQTDIEELMYEWVENGDASTQQLALRSLISFAELFDEDEEKEKQKILADLDEEEEKKKEKERQRSLAKVDKTDLYQQKRNSKYGASFILSWLTIILKGIQYIVFRNRFYDSFTQEWIYYRQVVSGVLPELLKQSPLSESGVASSLKKDLEKRTSTVKKTLKQKATPLTGIDLVLNKLASLSNRRIKIVADLLKLSVWIYRNLLLFIVGILAALFFWKSLFVLIVCGAIVAFIVIAYKKSRT